MNPLPLWLQLVVVIGLAGGSYLLGRTHMANERDAKALEQIERIEAARDESVARINEAAATAAAAQTQQATDFREITRETVKIVDRPVYRNLCVDADGVSLLDRAHAAANRGLAFSPADAAAGASSDAAR